MTPNQALQFLATVTRDDRLRFLNYREFAEVDKAIITLSEFIEGEREETKLDKLKKGNEK